MPRHTGSCLSSETLGGTHTTTTVSTPMFVPALRIALAKVQDPVSSAALSKALLAAESLAAIEADFESRINASKAKRGEKPTKLSRSRRSQVDQYAADGATLQAEQLAEFEASLTASQIAAALAAGLGNDLQFWATAAKYTHPDDMPVVNEFVNAKRVLHASLVSFLSSQSPRAA
jgi:hypothetical protein